ncbi:MAG TPA: hypothetical protein VLT63_00085 [Candidatus Acidoferrum sp.]|nr:hypothetical protein [Candidatus Acidoferrum sp.]
MKMITLNPFSVVKISKTMRLFAVGSVMASYGLFLYEFVPEYLFTPNYLLSYYLLPLVASFAVVIMVPKFLSKGSTGVTAKDSNLSLDAGQPLIETIPLDSNQQVIHTNTDNQIQQGINANTFDSSNTTQEFSDIANNSSIVQSPPVDEATIQEMVIRSIEPMQKETVKLQESVDSMKNDLNTMNSKIDALTTSFETTLTDLKSFQAELANPLNFMRKYFDSIDIKGLSDPSLPLQGEPRVIPKDASDVQTFSEESNQSQEKSIIEEKTLQQTPSNEKIENDDKKTPDSNESYSFQRLLSGSLTLGKLMSTISVMGEILETIDSDSVDLLIEQCRLMGLKPEDEQIIYNIINMMDKTGLSINDTLITLYKFGKVLGISDKKADLIYTKLTRSKKGVVK